MIVHSLPYNSCQNKICRWYNNKNACFHFTKDYSLNFCLFYRLLFISILPSLSAFPFTTTITLFIRLIYAWFPHIVWCCQWCLFDIREHIHSYFLFYYSDCKCHIVYLLPSFLSRKFSLRDYGLLCFISKNTCNISKNEKE